MRFFILVHKIAYSLWNEIVTLQKTNCCSLFHGMSLRYGKHKSNWILKQPKNLHQIQIQLQHSSLYEYVQSVKSRAVWLQRKMLRLDWNKSLGLATAPEAISMLLATNVRIQQTMNKISLISSLKKRFLNQRPDVMCMTYHPGIFSLR